MLSIVPIVTGYCSYHHILWCTTYYAMFLSSCISYDVYYRNLIQTALLHINVFGSIKYYTLFGCVHSHPQGLIILLTLRIHYQELSQFSLQPRNPILLNLYSCLPMTVFLRIENTFVFKSLQFGSLDNWAIFSEFKME